MNIFITHREKIARYPYVEFLNDDDEKHIVNCCQDSLNENKSCRWKVTILEEITSAVLQSMKSTLLSKQNSSWERGWIASLHLTTEDLQSLKNNENENDKIDVWIGGKIDGKSVSDNIERQLF